MPRIALLIGGLTALLLVALYGLARDRAPFGTLEGETLDWRFTLRGPIPPSGEVVLVAIDEASVQALGGWPLRRRVLAEAVERLSEAGTRVIAFDLLLLELEQPTIGGAPGMGDQRLIAAIRNARRVLLPFAFSFRDQPGSAPVRRDLTKFALPVRVGEPGAAGSAHPPTRTAPPPPLLEFAQTPPANGVPAPPGRWKRCGFISGCRATACWSSSAAAFAWQSGTSRPHRGCACPSITTARAARSRRSPSRISSPARSGLRA